MAELDGRWVTMNGARVFINSKGDVIMGLGKSYHTKKLNDDEMVNLIASANEDELDSTGKDGTKRGDTYAAFIGDNLGASQLPELITEDGLAAEVANGGVELWRGFGADGEAYIEEYKTGKCYYGFGVSGSGTYTSTDKEMAFMFAEFDKKNMAHMVLRADAKVIEYDTMLLGNYPKETRTRLKNIAGKLGSENRDRLSATISNFTNDFGIVGLINGYDAIRVRNTNNDIYVVLNRGAVKVVG